MSEMKDSLARQQALVEGVRQQLAQGGTARLRVTSNSMRPLLQAGDEVELAGVSAPACLRPGDVVTFDQAGELVTHRLIGQIEQAGGRAWLTQGDDLLVTDPAWPEAQLVGRVVAVLAPSRPKLQLECGAGHRLDAWLQAGLRAERRTLHAGRTLMVWCRVPPGVQRVGLAAIRRPFRLLATLMLKVGLACV